MDFAQRLKLLMESSGTTNYQLAKSINCHQTTIANILGGSKPQLRTKNAIAEHFGVTVSYLDGNTDDPHLNVSPHKAVSLEIDKIKSDYANFEKISGPISIEDLPGYKGYGQKEKPTLQMEDEPFEGYSDLTEEEKKQVRDYAAFLLASRHKQ